MFIYVVTNDVNHKSYVGLHTGDDLRKRWLDHLSAARTGVQTVLYHAMRKHGEEKFHIISLWSGKISLLALKQLERFFIKSFRTKVPLGYNTTDGGDGTPGFRHSIEERQRRREQIRKQIATGNIPSTRGTKRDPEIGKRITRAKLGKKRGSQTPEWRAKRAAAQIGNKNSLGHKQTAEHIAKKIAGRKARGSWNRRDG